MAGLTLSECCLLVMGGEQTTLMGKQQKKGSEKMRDNCNGKSKKALKSNEPQNDRNLLQAARDLLNALSGELKFNCAHQVRWSRTRPGLPLGNFGNPDTLNAQFNLSLRQSKLYLCGNLCRLICAKSNIKLLSCRQLSFICRRSCGALLPPLLGVHMRA